MLPNFLIIGAMKSGTTTLYSHLRQHPQIFMPAWKEPGFFAHDERWRRGTDWYQRLFSAATKRQLAIGEASPCYTKYPLYEHPAARIRQVLPDVRLIYILRNPIDRICSHYAHAVHAGDETRPPAVAMWSNPVYLDTSRYFMQLDRYLQRFSADQIFVVLLDDFQQHPAETLRRVFEFLGVNGGFQPAQPDLRRNASRGKSGQCRPLVRWLQRHSAYHSLSSQVPDRMKDWARRLLNRPMSALAPLDSELRARLGEALQQDIDKLSDFLGRNLDRWVTPENEPSCEQAFRGS